LEAKAIFKSVSKQKFKIQRLAQGIAEFVPVTFDDQYYSIANLTVQSILLDFRFRMRTFKSLKSEITSFQERGIIVKQQDGAKQHPKDDQDALHTQGGRP